eukprot:TRINITY_DN8271_c0_g1_i1.p1 TRINITY_DN8271_c0_g1~~TRINITY_DN8271_c0_g1_i1.p1  ORF type:complete len:1153 (+),score=287.54 TRINITY_DN8271_c0_g1_i1:274-3732(+)
MDRVRGSVLACVLGTRGQVALRFAAGFAVASVPTFFVPPTPPAIARYSGGWCFVAVVYTIVWCLAAAASPHVGSVNRVAVACAAAVAHAGALACMLLAVLLLTAYVLASRAVAVDGVLEAIGCVLLVLGTLPLCALRSHKLLRAGAVAALIVFGELMLRPFTTPASALALALRGRDGLFVLAREMYLVPRSVQAAADASDGALIGAALLAVVLTPLFALAKAWAGALVAFLTCMCILPRLAASTVLRALGREAHESAHLLSAFSSKYVTSSAASPRAESLRTDQSQGSCTGDQSHGSCADQSQGAHTDKPRDTSRPSLCTAAEGAALSHSIVLCGGDDDLAIAHHTSAAHRTQDELRALVDDVRYESLNMPLPCTGEAQALLELVNHVMLMRRRTLRLCTAVTAQRVFVNSHEQHKWWGPAMEHLVPLLAHLSLAAASLGSTLQRHASVSISIHRDVLPEGNSISSNSNSSGDDGGCCTCTSVCWRTTPESARETRAHCKELRDLYDSFLASVRQRYGNVARPKEASALSPLEHLRSVMFVTTYVERVLASLEEADEAAERVFLQQHRARSWRAFLAHWHKCTIVDGIGDPLVFLASGFGSAAAVAVSYARYAGRMLQSIGGRCCGGGKRRSGGGGEGVATQDGHSCRHSSATRESQARATWAHSGGRECVECAAGDSGEEASDSVPLRVSAHGKYTLKHTLAVALSVAPVVFLAPLALDAAEWQLFWFYLTVVVVYKRILDVTFFRSLLRLLATALGVVVGFLLMEWCAVATNAPLLFSYMTVCAYVTVLCSNHKYEYAFHMFLLTQIIMVSCQFDTRQCAATLMYGVARLASVVVGGATAVAVCMLVLPDIARDAYRGALSDALGAYARTCVRLLDLYVALEQKNGDDAQKESGCRGTGDVVVDVSACEGSPSSVQSGDLVSFRRSELAPLEERVDAAIEAMSDAVGAMQSTVRSSRVQWRATPLRLPHWASECVTRCEDMLASVRLCRTLLKSDTLMGGDGHNTAYGCLLGDAGMQEVLEVLVQGAHVCRCIQQYFRGSSLLLRVACLGVERVARKREAVQRTREQLRAQRLDSIGALMNMVTQKYALDMETAHGNEGAYTSEDATRCFPSMEAVLFFYSFIYSLALSLDELEHVATLVAELQEAGAVE